MAALGPRAVNEEREREWAARDATPCALGQAAHASAAGHELPVQICLPLAQNNVVLTLFFGWAEAKCFGTTKM